MNFSNEIPKRNFNLVNCDTDSISFSKKDGEAFSEEEQEILLSELNGLFPKEIKWEHDGIYKKVICLKAKNYILVTNNGKIKLKGSSLRDQKKEAALREMMDKMINLLIQGEEVKLRDVYKTYIREALNPKDIKSWASKKTITKAILNCATDPEARLNERKIYEAVKDIPGLQEGDKVYLYPNIISKQVIKKEQKNGKVKEKVIIESGLKHVDRWNGDHDADKLVERVVATVDIFSGVVDASQFIDYTLVKNRPMLQELSNETN